MKKTLSTLLLLLVVVTSWAQKSTISTRVIDASNRSGIVGAVVELAPEKSPEAVAFFNSESNGDLNIPNVNYGSYIIKTSFLGFENQIDTILVNRATTPLPYIVLKEATTDIETVVKEVKAMRASQKGDTLSYNAASFKVAVDADVEGLLKKMPGITVSDGEVTAQGESIKKIFVDGREFFGNDVTTALNTLPAEVVDQIEVYDKLSDNAELSGMDDGNGYKAINIVTRKNMREGFFGKLYSGYGYQPEVQEGVDHHKYTAGGNVNYFKGKSRFSVIGLFNNINQQNFSFEDILGVTGDSGHSRGSAGNYMVRPQAGVAAVNAIGVNYSGQAGKEDQLKLEASYFFNGTNTVNNSVTDRWYESPSPQDTLFTEGYSKTPNYNHRLNGRVQWKISPTQSLNFRQSFSYQGNNPYSTTDGAQWGESGYSVVRNQSSTEKGGYSSSSGLSFFQRLYKPGRYVSVNGNFSVRDMTNQKRNYSNGARRYKDPNGDPITSKDTLGLADNLGDKLIDLIYRFTDTPTFSRTLSGDVSYAEPLSSHARIYLKYQISNNYQSTEKSSYITGEDYNISGLVPDPATSNSYQTTYLKQLVGPGVYFSKGKSKLSASINYQYSKLEGNALLSGGEDKIKEDYSNLTYHLMGHLYINQENSVRMYMRSSTQNPSVNNLINTYDLSNMQYISKGNPNLDPSYSNFLNVRYINSNIEKGTSFMVMASASNTSDYIGKHTVIEPNPITIDGEVYSPLQYVTSVNLDNYWRLNGGVNYGFPITPIKCNLNLMAGVGYQITPSMFGGEVQSDGTITDGILNETDNIDYNFSAVIGSNISENVDFTLSWRGSYNEATNSASAISKKNKYINQTASAVMKFVFGHGFTFTGSATYKQYLGITNDYNDDFMLCNVYIGKKIFRNQRGELNLGVNDLLNQNIAFNRTVASGYTQNQLNSVIGRYFTLQFVYNLRSFGGKEARQNRGGAHPGGGMHGRPPHGEGHRPPMF